MVVMYNKISMKKLLIALFIICSFTAKSQLWQVFPQYGYRMMRFIPDSVLNVPLGITSLRQSTNNIGQLRYNQADSSLYAYTGFNWEKQKVGGSGGGTGTVTSFGFNNNGVITGTVTNPTTNPNLTISIPDASISSKGLLTISDWFTFNSKQDPFFLSTTGTSGVATWDGLALNIPNYTTDSTLYYTKYRSDTSRTNIYNAINGKQGTLTLTTTGTSGASTLIGNTLNIPQYSGGGTPAGNYGNIQLYRDGVFAAAALDSFTFNSQKLSIKGSIDLPNSSGSYGVIYKNGAKWLYNPGSNNDNIFLGHNSGNDSSNSHMIQNIGIGDNSLDSVRGFGNVAIGINAAQILKEWDGAQAGSRNVFIGYQAGLNAVGASHSVVIGANAGQSLQNGTYSQVLIGKAVGASITTGTANTLVGSAINTITGQFNAVIGPDAMQVGTSGSYNSILGPQAGNSITSGNNNTIMGYHAGGGDTSGSNNVLLGYYAGNNIVQGINNVYIGNLPDPFNTDQSNKLVIEASGGGSSTVLVAGDFANRYFAINKTLAEMNTNANTFQVGGTLSTTGKVGVAASVMDSTLTDSGSAHITKSLKVDGSFAMAYVAKTGAYTTTENDHTINCTTGTFTVTLQTAVGVTGREYVVKNTGTGVITVGTTSSQTIDGSTTYTLGSQYKYVKIQSDGANWIIIGNN